jgi:hypothetical protein
MVFLQEGESMQPNPSLRGASWLLIACLAWGAGPARAWAQQQQAFGQQPQEVPAQPYPQQQPVPQQPADYGAGAQQQVIIVPDSPVPPPGGYTLQQPDHYQQLQARLAFLRAERAQYSIGGSIVMLSFGGAMVILGASVGGVLRALDRDGYAESTVFDRDRASIIFFSIMGGGALLMTFGAIKLARRARMRRQYDPEIRQIREELRQMRQASQYTYGAVLDFGLTPAGFGARLRF